ncbi:MAG: glycosyltransferase family 39 protein, partial [Planctomycetes bacterium]|nr:glycosyltransferase family 39 protein [Planctomycetota bacterium]
MSATSEPRAATSRRAWPWWGVALLAFVLRAIVAHQYQSAHPNAELLAIDERAYDAWARRIAAGDWLGREVFFQEPLYPYLLGLAYRVCGVEHLLVRLVQALLGALLCVVAGKLAERWFGRAAGLGAALLLAAHAPLVLYPCFLLKEALFVPLLALSVLLLARTRDERCGGGGAWLAIGLLGGCGALLRGNVLVLLPLLVLAPVLRAWFQRSGASFGVRASFRRAGACLAGVALALAPVLLRNHAVGGVWVLTTSQAGTNLYAGNNAENEYGRAYEVSFVRGVPEHEADDWRRVAERRAGRTLDAAEVSAYWRDATFDSVRSSPALHARILWNKLRLTLGAYEVPDDHAFTWDVRYVPLLDAPWPGFGLLGAFGLAGLAWHFVQRARGARPPGGADELALVFVLYLGTIVLTVTSDRARLPLVPLLAPFAAVFALELAASARARAFARLLGLAGLLAACAAFVLVPVLPASERAEDEDERDFNLAALWALEPAQRTAAHELAARIAQRHPGSARTRLLVAGIELADLRAQVRDPMPAARAAAVERLSALAGELERLGED